MKYSYLPIDGEHIFRKDFSYKDGRTVSVICVEAEGEKKRRHFGFSVKSPTETHENRKRSLKASRGRARKAVALGKMYEYPEQRWLKRDHFVSMVNEYDDYCKKKNNNEKIKIKKEDLLKHLVK